MFTIRIHCASIVGLALSMAVFPTPATAEKDVKDALAVYQDVSAKYRVDQTLRVDPNSTGKPSEAIVNRYVADGLIQLNPQAQKTADFQSLEIVSIGDPAPRDAGNYLVPLRLPYFQPAALVVIRASRARTGMTSDIATALWMIPPPSTRA